MKINISEFDLNGISIRTGPFCGQESILFGPEIVPPVWTQKTKILRSSIWSKNWELFSAGFPKFTNWGESAENFPVPKSLKGANIVEKLDGSLMICDYVNDRFSMRTRGTFSYLSLENYKDFEYCIEKYPEINQWLSSHANFSLLFEITSPNQRIIIDYGKEPELTLIGAINKQHYSLMPQNDLDKLSQEINIKRPKRFFFNSIADLVSGVKKWEDLEGCCVYSDNEQAVHKIKADKYLKLHYFKSQLSSKSLLELWLENGMPDRKKMESLIESGFDWECLRMSKEILDQLYNVIAQIQNRLKEIRLFILNNQLELKTQKEAALTINNADCLESDEKGLAFNELYGRDINEITWRKLVWKYYDKAYQG